MAEATPPMNPGDFLALLNKQPRSPEEEAMLQAELLRQARAKAEAEQQQAEQSQENVQTQEQPAQPETPQDVNTQSDQVSVPENMQTPAEEQPQEKKSEEHEYSLDTMAEELAEGIDYLKSVVQTDEVILAIGKLLEAKHLLSK